MKQKNKLIIFGASGHAISVASVAVAAGFEVIAFVEDNPAKEFVTNIPVIKTEHINPSWSNIYFAIAIGHNFSREKIFNLLQIRLGINLKFPVLIHPSAVVGRLASLGRGTVVMPGAIIGPNAKIESFCIINTNASLDHDGHMQGFASLAPNVCTGGTVRIGCRTAISIGATLVNNVTIGDDVVVGGGSYVNKDIPSLCVAYGNPARIIRNRYIDTPYL